MKANLVRLRDYGMLETKTWHMIIAYMCKDPIEQRTVKMMNKWMWKLLAGALVLCALPVSASAQEEDACLAIEDCLDACEGPEDSNCIDACLAESTDEDVAAAFQEAINCLNNNECAPEDQDCLFEQCGDELLAVNELCGDEGGDDCDEEPGPDCCIFANDGECDEPDLCDPGTDTSDCLGGDNNDPAPPEETACTEFEFCLFEECGEGIDLDCLGACADTLDGEARESFDDLIACVEDSGCGLEDDECLEAACTNEGEAFDDACEGIATNNDTGVDNNNDGNNDGNNDDGNNDIDDDEDNAGGNNGADDDEEDDDGSGGGELDEGCAVNPHSSPSVPLGGAMLLLMGLAAVIRRRR